MTPSPKARRKRSRLRDAVDTYIALHGTHGIFFVLWGAITLALLCAMWVYLM